MVTVGAAFGRGPDCVRARLLAADCPIRPRAASGGATAGQRVLAEVLGAGCAASPFGADLDVLARWRVEEGLTIAEVAARAGRPAATVADQLREAGV